MMRARSLSTPVVGVTFVDDYPENMVALERAMSEAMWRDESLPVVLERQPDNENDPNAIAVHVPAVGRIGHLPRKLAASLAENLDAGEVWQGRVEHLRFHEDHPGRPGIDVHIWRIA